MSDFVVKDSGQRMEYESGMRRDVTEGKPDYLLVRDGPMFKRFAEHLTKGAEKYGKRNWQLASSDTEYMRFRESAARHFEQWLAGDRDEDHAAAVMFNINAAEYVLQRLADEARERLAVTEPAMSTRPVELTDKGIFPCSHCTPDNCVGCGHPDAWRD